MKLKEAVESGRPFRRTGDKNPGWYMVVENRYKPGTGIIVMQGNASYTRYTRHYEKEQDINADDFEIQELLVPKWIDELQV
jgi:hypothetical protein